MHKITFAIVLIILTLFVPSVSFSQEVQESPRAQDTASAPTNIAEKTIRVGFSDFYQFLEQDEDGVYRDYSYNYLEEISKYTNWRYEFIYGTWNECLEWLATGEIDLICMAQYSEERAQVYDFTAYEAGIEYALLLVSPDNDAIFYDDYESFDGLRVGFMKGSYQQTLFQQYAQRHHFSYVDSYYDSTEDFEKALADGEVDAIVAGNLQGFTDKKLVAKFSPMPYYFITTKGNDALVQQLNETLEKIQTSDIHFNINLYNKYYGQMEQNQLALTREEAAYVDRHPVLHVAYNKDWNPIAYYNLHEEKFDGVSAGIMDLISKKSQITFHYLPAKDEYDAVQMLENGTADIICGFPNLYPQEARQYHIILTNPFFQVPVTLAKRSDLSLEDVHTVAVPQSSLPLIWCLQTEFADKKLKMFPDTTASIHAALDGKADAVFENVYVLDQFSKNNYYKDLAPVISLRSTLPLCIAIKDTEDPALRSLMNKIILQIDSAKINDLVVTNTMAGAYIHPGTFIRHYALPLVAVLLILTLFILYQSKRRTEKYAFIDRLTDHDNETKFLLSAEKLLRKGYHEYSVVSLDIDKFKLINNMHSFETGNNILRAMSGILCQSLGSGELCCRKSDDHFIMLLRNGDEKLDDRLHAIIQQIDRLPQKMGKSFQYTVSGGVYSFEHNENDLHRAIGWASLARKNAKKHHRDEISYYDDAMRNQATQEQEIENHMHTAMANGEFQVYYQPKIRLADEKAIGAEALVRWILKDGTVVQPDTFIPIFEENGFVIKLDLYLFEQVCRQLRRWLDEDSQPCPISVNLSRVHLNQSDFHLRYLNIMKQYHIPSHLIEMELTESTIFENKQQMVRLLNELKQAGIAVAMDDFGSGYSSLNLMKDLPLNFIKLDKEFFNTASDSQRGKDVIQSVVYMAHKLLITVIAEGVETEEQANFLKKIGCEIVQGYYYAKPLPLADYERFVSERQ